MIFFGFRKAVVRIPNGSLIVEIMLKIPRFIPGKILVAGLNDSLSVLMFHTNPRSFYWHLILNPNYQTLATFLRMLIILILPTSLMQM